MKGNKYARKPAGYKTYKKVHQKISEYAVDTHKQELMETVREMLMADMDGYRQSIEDLITEALEIRTVKQLRTWLE